MYTKLFNSLTDSTIWREPDNVRIVWITMLAMSDKQGHVMASVPGLADRARVSLDKTVQALEKLSQPDEWSRSDEHEGRRIEKIGGGWALLNYVKYSRIRDEEERKEYMRNYMRKRRKQIVNNVSSVNSSKPGLAHTDVDIDLNSKISLGGGGSKKTAPPPNGNGKFSQSDFDERDLRKIAAAERELGEKLKASIGSNEQITDVQWEEAICEHAGLTHCRYKQLKKLQKAAHV